MNTLRKAEADLRALREYSKGCSKGESGYLEGATDAYDVSISRLESTLPAWERLEKAAQRVSGNLLSFVGGQAVIDADDLHELRAALKGISHD